MYVPINDVVALQLYFAVGWLPLARWLTRRIPARQAGLVFPRQEGACEAVLVVQGGLHAGDRCKAASHSRLEQI